MPIDWFTVVAQAINFLILVALLRYFLYGPIVRAIERREERVAERLEDAEQERASAEETRASLEKERTELDERRDEILSEAREKARGTREALEEEARERDRERREQWRRSFERSREAIVEELADRAASIIGRGVEMALEHLADARIQDAVVDAFTARLRGLEGDERDTLAEAVREEGAQVRSAREISDDQRERIANAVTEIAGEEAGVSFEEDGALILGVELRAGGRRVAWSARQIARDMEEALRGAVAEAAEDGPKAAEDASEDAPEADRESEAEGVRDEEASHAG